MRSRTPRPASHTPAPPTPARSTSRRDTALVTFLFRRKDESFRGWYLEGDVVGHELRDRLRIGASPSRIRREHEPVFEKVTEQVAGEQVCLLRRGASLRTRTSAASTEASSGESHAPSGRCSWQTPVIVPMCPWTGRYH